MLIVDKILSNAKVPEKAHSSDAGYDLFSAESKTIITGKREIFRTGIKISTDLTKYLLPPVSIYWRIAPRSGMACKHDIDVLAGVIDIEYTGEILICLINTSDKDYEIKDGDKIAQMIPTMILNLPIEEAKIIDSETRGAKGFGSSGN